MSVLKRFILTLACALGCVINAYADCAIESIDVFPREKSIKRNSIFVITAYANSQPIISGLNGKHKVYLQHGDSKVRLLVTAIYVGQFSLTQAMLTPEVPLAADVEYTLHIDGLGENETLGRFNADKMQYEPVRYLVESKTDTQKPQLQARPKELEKSLVYYGCGPSKYVIFSSPVKDDSHILVKTTVRNIKTGMQTTFLLEPADGEIYVGHGMCSGGFDFDNGGNYEVVFSFLDASGNLTPWKGQPIKFTAPTQSTGHDTYSEAN